MRFFGERGEGGGGGLDREEGVSWSVWWIGGGVLGAREVYGDAGRGA